MPRKFKTDEEKLIELVKDAELLYNPQQKHYKDVKKRRQAWEKISKKMNMPWHACRDQWRRLRNAYSKAKRRRSPKSSKTWKFEHLMSFLSDATFKEYVCVKKYENEDDDDEYNKDGKEIYKFSEEESQENFISTVFIPSEDQKSYLEVNEDPLMQPVLTVSSPNPNVILKTSAVSHIPSSNKRKFETTSGDEMDTQRETSRKKLKETCYATDEIELLFLSLARTVKKFTVDEQIQLKLSISNLVFQAELASKTGDNSGLYSHQSPSMQSVRVPSPAPSQHSEQLEYYNKESKQELHRLLFDQTFTEQSLDYNLLSN